MSAGSASAREPLEEALLELHVSGRIGPDKDRRAVAQRDLALELRGIGMDRHVRVARPPRAAALEHHHAGVGDDGAAGVREHRFEVHFPQPGKHADHPRHAAQHAGQGVEIRGRHVAIAGEQAIDAGCAASAPARAPR